MGEVGYPAQHNYGYKIFGLKIDNYFSRYLWQPKIL